MIASIANKNVVDTIVGYIIHKAGIVKVIQTAIGGIHVIWKVIPKQFPVCSIYCKHLGLSTGDENIGYIVVRDVLKYGTSKNFIA
jgi:hypothetical protein